MAFFDFDRNQSSQKRTAEAATPAARDPQEVRPVDLKHTLPEHVEAAEMTDNGVRLAMQMGRELLSIVDTPENLAVRFDGLGGTVNLELSELIVARVDDARVALRDAMKLADAGGDRAAHIAIAEEVESVSALTAVLVERSRS